MLNEIEKTDNFLKAINKYAEEQRKRIRQEADSFRQKELEKAEKDALRQAYEMIRKEMASVKNKVTVEVSKEDLKARKNISDKRNKIIDGVFYRTKVLIEDFTKTHNYKTVLEKSLIKVSRFISEGTTILFIREKDEAFSSYMRKIFEKECNIKILKEIELGGIKVQNYNMGIFIDETFDTKLEDQKEWFFENCAYELNKQDV